MQKFKSKIPEVIAFQWTQDIDLQEKLVELIGSSDFTLTLDEHGVAFLEQGSSYTDIYPQDWVVKFPDNSILSLEESNFNEMYVEVS